MRTYLAYGQRVIEWTGPRDADRLKVEAPLCLVTIVKGLHDSAGRQVVNVGIQPDAHVGEQTVIVVDNRAIQLLPGETEDDYRTNVLAEQAKDDEVNGLLTATIECGDERETFTFQNADEARGFWTMFRWAHMHEIDGHELNELSPEDLDDEETEDD